MYELARGGYIELAEPVLLKSDLGTGEDPTPHRLCLAACRQAA